MDVFLEEVESLWSDWGNDELLSSLSSRLDSFLQETGGENEHRERSVMEVVSFVGRLRDGHVSTVPTIVIRSLHLFGEITERWQLFDENLALLYCLVYCAGHSFESAVQRGWTRTWPLDALADVRSAVLDFFRKFIKSISFHSSTPLADEAIQVSLFLRCVKEIPNRVCSQMGQSLCTESCVSHIRMTDHLPPTMHQDMIQILSVPFCKDVSVKSKAHSLHCFLKLWRNASKNRLLKEKNGRTSSNEYRDLSKAVASAFCAESESKMLEFCLFLSTGLKKEMHWEEGTQMLLCLGCVMLQENCQTLSGQLMMKLLPNLLPALLHERVSVRKIFFSVLIPASHHALLNAEHQFFVEYITRGLCDRNANVRLKVVSDLQLLLTDVSLRTVFKPGLVGSLSELWTALLQKLLDVSKSVRCKALCFVKNFFEDFVVLGDRERTVFARLLEQHPDLAEFFTRQLLRITAARPDSALFLESSIQDVKDVLHSVAVLAPFQVALLSLALQYRVRGSPALFASLFGRLSGETILDQASAIVNDQQTATCHIRLKKFIALLPDCHLTLTGERKQNAEHKALAIACLRHLFELIRTPTSKEDQRTSQKTLLSIGVVRAGLKKCPLSSGLENVMALLYTIAVRLLDLQSDGSWMVSLSLVSIFKAIKHALEQLQAKGTSADSQDMQKQTVQGVSLLYAQLLIRRLKESVKSGSSLVVQDALVHAICSCPEAHAQLMSMVHDGSISNDAQHQILICLSAIRQECKSIKTAVLKMQQQLCNVQTDDHGWSAHDLSKAEMDDFVKSATDAFVSDLISTNNLKPKAEWLVRTFSDQTCQGPIKVWCLRALWKMSDVSSVFTESLVNVVVDILERPSGAGASLSLVALSCCADLFQSSSFTDSTTKQCLSDALISLIARMSAQEEESIPEWASLLLENALFALGVLSHAAELPRRTMSQGPLFGCLGHTLMSPDVKVRAISGRVVRDLMLANLKNVCLLLIEMLCAVDASSASDLAPELSAVLVDCVRTSAKPINEGQLAKDLIQFYIEIEQSSLKDAAVELLSNLKPSRQALIALLHHWKASPQQIPAKGTPATRSWKQIVQNYSPSLMPKPKRGKERPDDASSTTMEPKESGGKLQTRLLELLGSESGSHPITETKRHIRKRGQVQVDSKSDAEDADDIAEALLNMFFA